MRELVGSSSGGRGGHGGKKKAETLKTRVKGMLGADNNLAQTSTDVVVAKP